MSKKVKSKCENFSLKDDSANSYSSNITKNCLYCWSAVKPSEDFLSCSFCSQLLHSSCHGLSPKDYKVFKEANYQFFCHFCDPIVRTLLIHEKKFMVIMEDLKDLHQKYDKLAENHMALKQVMAQVIDRFEDHQDSVKDQLTKHTNEVNDLKKSISDSMVSQNNLTKIKSVVQDLCNSEVRSTHLICFGLPECSENSTDLTTIKFITQHLDLDPTSVLNCSRLGGQASDHVRPLQIQFTSRSAAINFLKRPKVKITSENSFEKIWFCKDLSLAECVTDFQLRSELFEKRKLDLEAQFIIFYGKIIRKAERTPLQF